MSKILRYFRICIADARGATAVEYGLICSLIILAMLTALQGVASENTKIWNTVKTAQANAVSSS